MNGPKLIYGGFNARLHFRNANEHDVLGPYCFGDRSTIIGASHDRSLLIEACTALKLCVANTFIEEADEALITFWATGANPMADISHRAFARLDLCMVEQQWQEFIIDS